MFPIHATSFSFLSLLLLGFFLGFMAALSCAIPSEADFKILRDAYGLSSSDGVEFP